MVDAKLCAQHLLLKRMIQIDVGAICHLRVSTTRTWVRIADIWDETVDCVSVQFFASNSVPQWPADRMSDEIFGADLVFLAEICAWDMQK